MNKLSACVKDNFGFSLYPMLVIKGHSCMVSDLIYKGYLICQVRTIVLSSINKSVCVLVSQS